MLAGFLSYLKSAIFRCRWRRRKRNPLAQCIKDNDLLTLKTLATARPELVKEPHFCDFWCQYDQPMLQFVIEHAPVDSVLPAAEILLDTCPGIINDVNPSDGMTALECTQWWQDDVVELLLERRASIDGEWMRAQSDIYRKDELIRRFAKLEKSQKFDISR